MMGMASFFRRARVWPLVVAAWCVIGLPPALAQDPAASAWERNDHAQVRLVSATTAAGEADSVRLGLHFRLAPGWKIYWRSPGDAGLPPRIDWSGSQNVAAATIRWPAPERFELFGLDTFGYGGEVVLPIDLQPARAGEAVRLAARVDYLICEQICIPYEASLAFALAAGPARPSAHAHLIDRFNARVPGDGKASGLTIERATWSGGESPVLSVTAAALTPFRAPEVFVESPSRWSFGKPVASFGDGGRRVVLRVPARSDGRGAADLAGETVTLTLVDGERAAERTVPVERSAAAAASGLGLVAVLGLALLGGLILNLMPCVLPVLSIKLLNVVAHAGAARATIRANFLASAAGILASFLVLAAGLIALKSAGHAVGWGIQFQAPSFLIAMALVLTVFAANLWGWFEFRMPGVVNDAAVAPDRGGLAGAFVTGMFATLLATPCSAPFLGTAIGFALASGPAEIVAVFVALGIGLALPYLVVAAVPSLARALPRPGRWIMIVRRVLGVALLATSAWLLWVLAAQIDRRGIAVVAALLALLLGFLWLVREAGSSRRWIRAAGIAAAAALALAVPARFAAEAVPPQAASPGWQAFDRAAIDRQAAEGRVVLVDVTADWCITCQVNKTLVLGRGAVAARLAGADGGVVAMRADWTLPDPRIAEYLGGFGRYGIPFNAVYGPAAPEGIPLPELLTADAVLEALDRAAGAPRTAAAPERRRPR